MAAEDGNNNSKVPQWVTADLFEPLLRERVENFKAIAEFKAKPALAAGENYATIMLRVDINVELTKGSSQSLSYMMKIPPHSEMFLEWMKEHNVFDVEADMYSNIVPELCELYKNVGVDMKFGAESLKLKTEQNTIVLQDLRPFGFKNADRLQGLDMTHTKCVLTKIAQWHAASAHRVATKGSYSELYTVGFFNEKSRPLLEQMQSGSQKALLQSASAYKGHEVFLPSLEKYLPQIVDDILKAGQVDDNAFNVLNHGDLWCNNIMFKYDEDGDIVETFLVDYQIPKYGPPSQDLYYFLLSSTKLDIKLKEFDELVKFYYDQLIMHLKVLDYPKRMPTLREIQADLYRNSVWALYTVTGVMGAVLLDPAENANLENFLSETEEGNDFKKLMFSNDRYRSHVEQILPWLLNRGAMST